MPPKNERKFLVNNPAPPRNLIGARVSTAFISTSPLLITARIDHLGRAWLSVTNPPGVQGAAPNVEYSIPRNDAMLMMAVPGVSIINKTVYRLPFEGRLWALDVFEGALYGLGVLRVDVAPDAPTPTPPAWAGSEVTDQRVWDEVSLARAGRPAA